MGTYFAECGCGMQAFLASASDVIHSIANFLNFLLGSRDGEVSIPYLVDATSAWSTLNSNGVSR